MRARYEEDPRGHTWERKEDGSVNDYAMEGVGDEDHHNGPRCVTCGFTFCEHCCRYVTPQACTKPKTSEETR